MTGVLTTDRPGPAEVLVALTGPVETAVVRALDADGRTRVAGRCADVAELLALAQAGRGDAAVVQAGLARLDPETVARIRITGCAVVAVLDPNRLPAAQAWALGADAVVALSGGGREADPAAVVEAVAALPARARAGTPMGPWSQAAVSGPVPRPAGLTGPGHSDPLAVGAPVPGPASPRVGPRHPGHVVTVWGPPGAPGRTTLAVNLAAELAATQGRVLLVDADTHAASVATHLGVLDEAAGVVGAVRAAMRGALTPAALAGLAPTVLPGLQVLTGITRSARWPELRPAGFEALLTAARRSAEVVVLDVAAPLDRDDDAGADVTAARRNGATLLALERADTVVVVGAADPVGLQRLVRSLQELHACALPTPGARLVTIVNKARPGAVGGAPGRRVGEVLGRFAGVTDPVLVPWDPAATDAALLVGRTLAEAVPGSPVRRAIRDLAGRLLAAPPPVGQGTRLRSRRP